MLQAIVGILFLGIGVGILITSLNIQELEIDYTNCNETIGGVDSKNLCKNEINDFRELVIFKSGVTL